MGNSQIDLNWNSFMWIVQFNYHICDTGGPINICESGWIQVSISLYSPLNSPLDSPLNSPLNSLFLSQVRKLLFLIS